MNYENLVKGKNAIVQYTSDNESCEGGISIRKDFFKDMDSEVSYNSDNADACDDFRQYMIDSFNKLSRR